jgi:hypothetical protein
MFSTFDKKINFYSRLDDRHIRGSTASDLKLPPESDTDSIADYADGENAGNEKTQFFRIFVQKIFFSSFFVIPLYCCNDNPRMHGNSYQGKLKCLVLHQTSLPKKGRFVNVCFILFMKLVKRWYA